jgi:hypothetical protein
MIHNNFITSKNNLIQRPTNENKKKTKFSNPINHQVCIEENKNSRKDWPFVPYKKRNFKFTDEQSSSSFSSTISENQNNKEIELNDSVTNSEVKVQQPERQKKSIYSFDLIFFI